MNKGVWYGIASYALWGILPVYWKALHSVPSLEIVANRLSWSLIFLVILITVRKEWAAWKGLLNRKTLLVYLGASVFLSVNWLVYIWSVNHGYIVEASLGYFINPLVNVLLAIVFLKETLTPTKWIAIGLATVGVIYLTFNYGAFPWIALALAFSFGIYGLIKKLSPLGSLQGLTMETGILFIPAVAYLGVLQIQGVGSYGHIGPVETVLLILSGVITAIPLLLFASAARSIPLSTMGLLQYVSPTLQFLLGVFVYHEAFNSHQLIGFCVIWAALIVFTAGSFLESRRSVQAAAS